MLLNLVMPYKVNKTNPKILDYKDLIFMFDYKKDVCFNNQDYVTNKLLEIIIGIKKFRIN